jgi:hypothetical protein
MDEAIALATVERLVTAADGDTLYRDVYLRQAAAVLSPLATEAAWTASLTSRAQLDRLLAHARAAVGRQDWTAVGEIGAQAAGLQRSLEVDKSALAAAEAVYGAPPVIVDPLSPGLTSRRWPNADQARTAVCSALADLARDDAGRRELYESRRRALEALALPGGTTAAAKADASAGNVEMQALAALERGDAAALQGLAEAIIGRRAATTPPTAADVPADRRTITAPATLGESLPPACLSRATTLGLEPVVTELPSSAVVQAVGDFIERYALGASPAVHDRAHEGIARVFVAAEEIAVPTDVARIFAETISLFALHLYVNSAGIRYVPLPVAREALLMETHAEGEAPVTSLVRELGFDGRRGLSRDAIEAALLEHGARIVAEHLGLDPLAFRIVCVPPDVFMRLGRERGWGTRPEWTHFDGYQVMRGGRLRALVGGNVQFGGIADLCSIARDDERENTVARFAVIRRDRLGVRIG